MPMGGLFSAEGADLHSIWNAYVHTNLFRWLGNRTVSPGIPMWEVPYGRVALCQFRDNILVATDGPRDACAPVIN